MSTGCRGGRAVTCCCCVSGERLPFVWAALARWLSDAGGMRISAAPWGPAACGHASATIAGWPTGPIGTSITCGAPPVSIPSGMYRTRGAGNAPGHRYWRSGRAYRRHWWASALRTASAPHTCFACRNGRRAERSKRQCARHSPIIRHFVPCDRAPAPRHRIDAERTG